MLSVDKNGIENNWLKKLVNMNYNFSFGILP